MSRMNRLDPEFVEEIPRELAPGTLYVSIVYATAVHLCCCGCGREVVTPLHPTRWALTYDGETVSLHPSVGSWGLPCKSHYVIRRSRVRWGAQFSEAEIEAVRRRDRHATKSYFSPSADSRDERGDSGDDKGSRMGRAWRRLRARMDRGTASSR